MLEVHHYLHCIFQSLKVHIISAKQVLVGLETQIVAQLFNSSSKKVLSTIELTKNDTYVCKIQWGTHLMSKISCIQHTFPREVINPTWFGTIFCITKCILKVSVIWQELFKNGIHEFSIKNSKKKLTNFTNFLLFSKQSDRLKNS